MKKISSFIKRTLDQLDLLLTPYEHFSCSITIATPLRSEKLLDMHPDDIGEETVSQLRRHRVSGVYQGYMRCDTGEFNKLTKTGATPIFVGYDWFILSDDLQSALSL